MNKHTYFGLCLFLVLGFLACESSVSIPNPSKGEIDVSNIVFIGDGSMGGFMNDGMNYNSQRNSLSALLSQQFQLIGGDEIHLPWINEASVGTNLNGLAPFILGYKTDCKGISSLSPMRSSNTGDVSIFGQTVYQSGNPFNGFGIPGLRSNQLNLTNLASVNPFFTRMASTSNASVLGDVMSSAPSFFSLYLGLEDVLDFAKSGGTHQTLPSEGGFQANYEQIIQTLCAAGAKGVISTIPDVSQMPYFTTIPWNGLNLDNANLSTLNSIYNPLGYYFELGANPFMMVDSSANTFAVRQILPTELLLLSLPLDSVKCNQMGVLFPIRDEFVLDAAELSFLRTKIQAYNTIIVQIAEQYNLALVDANQLVATWKSGFTYNGVNLSAKFVSGGVYSLDGIYFNPRGNALFANEFIKSINHTYHATIPLLNALAFDGIRFP